MKKKIAVFANGWSNEFLEKVLVGIQTEAAGHDVDIFVFLTYIFMTDPAPQSMCQLNIMHLPKPEDFDGAIVLANTFNTPNEKERVCKLFQSQGIPMISTEARIADMAFIGTDNYSGVRELAEHIIEVHKAKRILYINGITSNPECAIRKAALVDVLHEHGLELIDSFNGNFTFYDAMNNLDIWLNEGNELPDAIVCANDFMAMGVMDILHRRKIRVPEDVLVTGFDAIREGRTYLPILATVSRQWEKLGANAFTELLKLMEEPNPELELILPSKFIPSESCGCVPSEEALEFRNAKLRNAYYNKTMDDLLEIRFQSLRIASSKVDSKEKFSAVARNTFGDMLVFNFDFSICIEPEMFEPELVDENRRIRGYSKQLDVICENRGGVLTEKVYSFDSRDVVPNYCPEKGRSDMYIITPLNNGSLIIGYIVLKNTLHPVGNLSLRKWAMNMNSLFVTIKQYIIVQTTNRKLTEIYMTDFLTGMYNRTGCDQVIYKHIEDEKAAGRQLVLLFADIDNMKVVNDKYGHLNGDLAIKATADALRSSLNGSWLMGRYGGDEFIAVGDCENDRKVSELKDSLSLSIKEKIESFNLQFNMTVSVGYVIINPNDNFTIDDYIQCADESMYEEKEKAHRLLKK